MNGWSSFCLHSYSSYCGILSKKCSACALFPAVYDPFRTENSLWPISWVCFGPISLCLVRATVRLVNSRYRKNSVNSQFVVFSVQEHLSSFHWHVLCRICITINMTKTWESPPQINMQHCVIYIQCQHYLLDCQCQPVVYLQLSRLNTQTGQEENERVCGGWEKPPVRRPVMDRVVIVRWTGCVRWALFPRDLAVCLRPEPMFTLLWACFACQLERGR